MKITRSIAIASFFILLLVPGVFAETTVTSITANPGTISTPS